jgi:glycerol uptake operon antiterminator
MPDYVEILPGIACSILPYIQSRTQSRLMSGGLIRTPEELKACFDAGACAVTVSRIETIRQYKEFFGSQT